MGNTCCEIKKYVVDFNQCFDLKCVTIVLAAELKRIHRISKAITFQNTINDNYDHSLFRDRSEQEMKKFYFYLKLEIVLVRIKHYIEENTIPKKYLDLERNEVKKHSTLNIIPKRRDSSNTISTADESISSSNSTSQNITQNSFDRRRVKKSHTTKTVFKVKAEIPLQNCIRFLTEIMDTEEHYNEEALLKLENMIEKRLFEV
jgi:hypothetical protein